MSQQNLLSVGFNIPELTEQAAQVEAIVVGLYNELKKYDGMKISPINVSGLSELITATKAQQVAVEGLTVKMTDLGLAMKTHNDLAAQVASNNAKIAASESDVAKAAVATKVELQEVNKEMIKNAQENNARYQQRMKLLEDERELNKLIAEEEKANQKKKTQANNEYESGFKKLVAEEKTENKNKIKDANQTAEANGRAMLKENDLYKRLLQQRADLRVRYQNALISGAPKAARNELANELTGVSTAIDKINTAVGKTGASGGAMENLGKMLTNNLSLVRNLAYIIPGLGIAGIFGLIGEAIMKVVEELGFFKDSLKDAVEYENRMTESIKNMNKALVDQADALEVSDKHNADYLKRQKELAAAGGENYKQQTDDIDKYNKAVKEGADNRVTDTKSTFAEQATLVTQLESFTEQRQKIVNKIEEQDKKIKVKQEEKLPFEGFVAKAIAKSGAVAGMKKNRERLDEELKLLDSKTDAAKDRLGTITDALQGQTDAGAAMDEERAKRAKYFSTEAIKQTLINEEARLNIIKDNNKKILNDVLSTEEQRIAATRAISKAEADIALAKRTSVLSNANATETEILQARKDYAVAVVKIENDLAEDVNKIVLTSYLKHSEYQLLAAQEQIRIHQITDKKVMENEQNTFDTRISAYAKYNQDREDAAITQYNADVAKAKKTVAPDFLKEALAELESKKNAKIADIQNDLYKQSYDIATSWFDIQYKQLKLQSDKNVSAAQDVATKELTILTESFNKKEISYKEYRKKVEELEFNSRIKIDKAQEVDDQKEIKRLTGLQNDVKAKLQTAIYSIASGGGDTARGLAKGFKDEYDKMQKQIDDTNDQAAKHRLKTAQDSVVKRIKADEEAQKQIEANWEAFEKEMFNLIQTIGNAAFESRIEQLQKLQEEYDKTADAEIEALQRSTLSEKEKNAYEVQLQAQKAARDEEFARQERKIKHDQAVFNKEVAISEIILGTTVAIVNALKIEGGLGIPLAISIGALGAAQLATALATKIPAYAEGGIHKSDGLALFGEAGAELVKEPRRAAYIADKPTIKHLSAGTELIPLYKIPVIPEKQDSSWAQTLYLGKAIAKSKREIKNVFKPKINVDLGSKLYQNRILHGLE